MGTSRKNIIKKTVDALMTVLLLCLMAYQVTGEALHEWGGIAMTALLVVHHILNFKWYKSLFKGKYNAYRVVTVALNTLLLASIALTALCGMAMSSHALPFLYGMLPVSFARRFHLAMSFWSYILMGLHLGLHIPAMTAGIRLRARASYAVWGAAVIIAGVGLWLFVKNGIPDYIFFRTPFAFLDFEKAAALVFLENLAILIAFTFLGAETASFIKAAQSKGNARKFRTFITAILVLAALLIGAALIIFTDGKTETSPSWGDPAPQTQTNESAAPNDTSSTSAEVKPQTDPASVADGFILLDGGTFMMGSPESENWRVDDEKRHEVTVSAFYIDPYETTQKEYARVTGANPGSFSGGGALSGDVSAWLDTNGIKRK